MGTQTNTAEVIEFKLPKRRPKIVEKDAPPDQRSLAVVPLRAIRDRALTDGQLRALAILCSYCNRAGITWVSQGRLAKDMQVSQQSISKHLKALSAAGYIEVTAKGFRGERANTTRVIYDPTVTQVDAIAITSGQEDTRPPETRRRETKEMAQQGENVTRSGNNQPSQANKAPNLPGREPEFTEEQMAANRKRLREMLGGLATRDGFHYNRPERIGDIMARKPKAKQSSHTQPNEVVNDKGSHTQPHTQPNTVVETQKNIGIDRLFMSIGLEINKELKKTLEDCLDSKMIITTFDELKARYAAEGLDIPKNPEAVVEMMILLAADASLTRSEAPPCP
jgi:DNA-binding transcriptional ArsR family regulator